MKKITKDELETFLRKHKLWLVGDKDGESKPLWSKPPWSKKRIRSFGLSRRGRVYRI